MSFLCSHHTPQSHTPSSFRHLCTNSRCKLKVKLLYALMTSFHWMRHPNISSVASFYFLMVTTELKPTIAVSSANWARLTLFHSSAIGMSAVQTLKNRGEDIACCGIPVSSLPEAFFSYPDIFFARNQLTIWMILSSYFSQFILWITPLCHKSALPLRTTRWSSCSN